MQVVLARLLSYLWANPVPLEDYLCLGEGGEGEEWGEKKEFL